MSGAGKTGHSEDVKGAAVVFSSGSALTANSVYWNRMSERRKKKPEVSVPGEIDNSQLLAAFYQNNRRMAVRRPRSVKIFYRTEEGESGEGTSLDLSRTGVRTVLQAFPGSAGTLLSLEFNQHVVMGRTVWRRELDEEDHCEAGVRFLFLSPEQEQELERMLLQDP